MKNMNLPNKLTMLRVILIPFFVVCELIPYSWGKWVALVIFVAASITDKLDGTIARKYNLITNFGKFMDPLADKLLVCSAMICFVGLGTLAPWIVIIIVAREFIIGFALWLLKTSCDCRRNLRKKAKTVVQMIMCILLIMDVSALSVVTTIAIYAALILTIISLVDYIVHNLDVLSDQK